MAQSRRPAHRAVQRDPADVGRVREQLRRQRLGWVALVLAVPLVWLWLRLLTGRSQLPQLPELDPIYLMTGLFFAVLIAVLLGSSIVAGRSPHVMYRPEQLDVGIADVRGLGPLTEDVARTLDLFLAGRTFRRDMGGTPRRGLLFEGPPGTGKTYLAKAMARDAGVPFLFVSATSFQSMYYGATSRKIRSYFKALRAAARREGGAIGFIEEIDAIATARGGVASRTAARPGSGELGCGGLVGLPFATATTGPVTNSAVVSEGVGGVVNELLIQLQSFDAPTPWQQVWGGAVDSMNLLLPAHRQLRRPAVEGAEILLIAATNRADSLDPALLRPGRFDRRMTFEPPGQAGRREIIDHYLDRKAHDADLDGDGRRDQLAGLTQGYTPAMLEQLLDEALIQALRRNAPVMAWPDLVQARLLVEVGLGQPVAYTVHEERLIATHEAGHAVLAWLLAPHRRLEVLTIIKRKSSLGMLAHGDSADVYTRSASELKALISIAFGGQVAEESFFGQVSTGPSSDLAYATTVAAQMVGAAGMAGSPVSLAACDGGPGQAGLVTRVLTDPAGRESLEVLLRGCHDDARLVVEANAGLVVALRDALLVRQELVGHEITDVLEEAARTPGPGA